MALRLGLPIGPGGLERIEAFKEEWREIMLIYKFVTKEEENE